MKQVVEVCEFLEAEQFMWSDSMIALSWIKKSPLVLKQYVANRVEIIQQNSSKATWSHVSTTQNPADLLSRVATADELLESKLWKRVPDWLLKKQEEWPKPMLVISPQDNIEISKEMKQKQNLVLSVMIANINDEFRKLWYKTDNWREIVRITAYVLRFIRNTQMKNRSKWIRGWPHAEEIKSVVIFWIKYAQARVYKKEIKALKANHTQLMPKAKLQICHQ